MHIINKKDRKEVLLERSKRLKNFSGDKTLNAMLQLNRLNLEMCKSSIKIKNPKIGEKELLKELKKVYWKDERT